MRRPGRARKPRQQPKRRGASVRRVCDHCGKKFAPAAEGTRYYCGAECARTSLSLRALFQ